MARSVGEKIPDVAGVTHDGREVRLSELAAGGSLVVFFYPKAFTPGCTAEACYFRDRAADFEAVGATPIGVSRDKVDTQGRFAVEHGLGYPLLADPDGAIARAFGAKRPGPLPSKRETYVVDSDLTLLGRYRSETNMRAHADEALELLRARSGLHDATE